MNGRLHRWVSVGLVLAGTAGCGGGEERSANAPEILNLTKGAVTMNGKDIENGAIVVFHPKAGATPEQTVWGTYQTEESYYFLSTEKGGKKTAGAPEGEYVVTIQPQPNSRGTLIPAKYANPATSGLTAEIKKGPNTIPEMKLSP